MNYAQLKREKRAHGEESRRPAVTRDAAAFGALPEALNQSVKVQAQLRLDRSLNQPRRDLTAGVAQRVLKVAGKRISVEEVWNQLAAGQLDVSEAGAKRVLSDCEEGNRRFKSFPKLVEWLADAGYEEN